jgi:inhibitor of KinA sporulation pathway (predicted exonuclease)
MRSEVVLVVDVECTCWPKGLQPEDQTQEIIEIGVVPVNIVKMDIGATGVIRVKPERSSISQYCTDLTGITEKDLENAVSYQESVNWLREKFNSPFCAMASWGAFDRFMFERMSRINDCWYPFCSEHIDIKTLFSLWNGAKKGYGLEKAIKRLGMTFEGAHHNAGIDAENTAKIFLEMIGSFRVAFEISQIRRQGQK